MQTTTRWVFGYGSLVWRPAFRITGESPTPRDGW
jgi:cation transport regulator ChaC